MPDIVDVFRRDADRRASPTGRGGRREGAVAQLGSWNKEAAAIAEDGAWTW